MVAHKAEQAEQKPKPIFFWGHKDPYPFMNQHDISYFTSPDGKIRFNCAEQWMMWHKALVFSDFEMAIRILMTDSPAAQKALGREVRNYDDKTWTDVRLSIVEQGSYLKYSQDPKLKSQLLATGDTELVEASPYDRIWGIGYSPQDAPHSPRDKWGQNLLGRALMTTRTRLRNESDAAKNWYKPESYR